jgi:putative flippase GtrA
VTRVITQLLKFSGCGAVATFAQYLILMVLVKTVFLSPILASAIGFVIGAIISYFLNYKLTFCSKKSHKTTMAKFFVIALIGIAINTCILSLAITVLHLYYLWAQFIATFFVLFWNFTWNYFWTFEDKCFN